MRRCLSGRRLAWWEVVPISEGDVICFGASKDSQPRLSPQSQKKWAFEVSGLQTLLGNSGAFPAAAQGSQQATRIDPEGRQQAARAEAGTLASIKTEPMPIAATQPPPAQQDQDSKQDVVMVLDNGSNEEDDDIEIEIDVSSPRHYQPPHSALKKSSGGAKPLLVLVLCLAREMCSVACLCKCQAFMFKLNAACGSHAQSCRFKPL